MFQFPQYAYEPYNVTFVLGLSCYSDFQKTFPLIVGRHFNTIENSKRQALNAVPGSDGHFFLSPPLVFPTPLPEVVDT